MGVWNSTSTVITNAGMNLLTDIAGKKALKLSRVVAGSDYTEPAELKAMTAISHQQMDMSFSEFGKDENGTAFVDVYLDNSEVTEAFYHQQIGIFAKDSADNEVLFLVAQADSPDYIPKADAPVFITHRIFMKVLGDSEVEVIVDFSGVVTQDVLLQKLKKKKTQEQNADGSYETITADFRKYPCVEDSVADHSAYLLGAKNGRSLRYKGIKGMTDYKKVAQLIKDGGYATYAKVQERLNRRAKAADNHGYEKTFFAGLVKCGKCGYACNHVLYHRQPADRAYIECNKRKTKECDLLPIREAELKTIMEQVAGRRENVEQIILYDGHIDFLMKDGTVKSHIREFTPLGRKATPFSGKISCGYCGSSIVRCGSSNRRKCWMCSVKKTDKAGCEHELMSDGELYGAAKSILGTEENLDMEIYLHIKKTISYNDRIEFYMKEGGKKVWQRR